MAITQLGITSDKALCTDGTEKFINPNIKYRLEQMGYNILGLISNPDRRCADLHLSIVGTSSVLHIYPNDTNETVMARVMRINRDVYAYVNFCY